VEILFSCKVSATIEKLEDGTVWCVVEASGDDDILWSLEKHFDGSPYVSEVAECLISALYALDVADSLVNG
jgi:hypothetical protein